MLKEGRGALGQRAITKPVVEAFMVRKMDDGTTYVCYHKAPRCPIHRIDIAPDGSTRVMWAFGKWSEAENLQYVLAMSDISH